jgi:dienelactone hydrolase
LTTNSEPASDAQRAPPAWCCSRSRRSILKFISLAAALLFGVLPPACGAAANDTPDRLPDVAGATTVSVPGAGVTLSGYLLRPSRRARDFPGVLLLHGSGTNAEDLLDTARSLADRGYVSLALTMRGFRGSTGEDDCGAQQADDAVQALNWLAKQPGVDGSRLGVLGYGQGGQVAMLAAARTTLLHAVVAFFPVSDIAELERSTPYQSVRDYVNTVCRPQTLEKVSPIANAAAINAPVLLIHGARDDRVPAAQSEAMRTALQVAHKSVEVHILPQARHEFTPMQFEESWPWVVSFLASHQMLSLASRTHDQQRRVNIFTEQGWASRLGGRGIKNVRQLGPIQRERVTLTENPHVRGRKDELREFIFDGLYVRALFPGRSLDAYLLQEVEITKPRWKVKYGLNVGATRETMLQTLGQPDGEKSEFVEYFHSMGIGTARIWFVDDRITKLEWEFRAD